MGGCEWIDLAEDWDKLRAVVQMLRNFGFHTLRALSSKAEELTSFSVNTMLRGFSVFKFYVNLTVNIH
jgi:hypothetical protein